MKNNNGINKELGAWKAGGGGSGSPWITTTQIMMLSAPSLSTFDLCPGIHGDSVSVLNALHQ